MKELPYFKFDCSEWISGNITLEDFHTQGVFINICAFYWFKSGCLKTSEIKQRLKCKQSTIDQLFTNGHLKSDGEFVKISFLDEQFAERGHKSKINSLNGSFGGAPKGNKNAQKNNRPVDLEQPKTSNIEEEENKKKKRIRTEENTHESFSEKFEKAFNDLFLDPLPLAYPDAEIKSELQKFLILCNSIPDDYHQRDVAGLQKGFLYQLKTAKRKSNGKQNFDQQAGLQSINDYLAQHG